MLVDRLWKEKFKILSFHMDPRSKAHITSLCNFLQEGAGAHAENTGFGFDDMMSRNQVWVLSRLKVEIEEYPAWNDDIVLHTWSRGREGIFYLRDFEIKNIHNDTIVKASSSWAAINTKTRRPGIVEGLEEGLLSNKDKNAFKESLDKLPDITNQKLLRKRKIEFTDIDLVYHVNNVKYIELIINSFPSEILMNKRVKSLEINYLGEAKYEEEVSVFSKGIHDNIDLVNVVRESDQKEVCRARLIWNNM